MKLNQVGEFGLIELIKKKVFSCGRGVVLGIGDDAAILKSSPHNLVLLTTDALVEKVHFDLRYFPLEAVGWKGMVANLSDIAAMGGIPKGAVVTIGVNQRFEVDQILSIYSGISKAARRFDCPIVGGDVVFSPQSLFVSMAILGEVKKRCVVKRIGAEAGDLIAVTGDLGGCLAGLEYLKRNKKHDASLTGKFLYPYPRLKESQLIVSYLRPRAMIDISDGLVSELHHLTVENNLGANIHEEDLPISKIASQLAKNCKTKALNYALYSGEEYELLLTFDETRMKQFRKLGEKIKISIIGQVIGKDKKINLIRGGGKSRSLSFRGYVHF